MKRLHTRLGRCVGVDVGYRVFMGRRARSKAPPRRETVRERLALDERGDLTVAVISDTHSKAHPRAAELVRALRPAHVLHAGDVGDLAVLAPFRAIAPLTVVRGNIDARTPDLPDDAVLEVTEASGQPALRLLLTHVAVRGARLRADAARLAAAHDARVVICGHSHVPFVGEDRGVVVFNAGSIGPRRFHLPIVFGVLAIRRGRLTMHHVDCETGEPWRP
jgi:putative phosphoesterase